MKKLSEVGASPVVIIVFIVLACIFFMMAVCYSSVYRDSPSANDASIVTILLWILGGMQSITILIQSWARVDTREWRKEHRKEMDDVWSRVNNHGHEVVCKNASCKPKTRQVGVGGTKE